MEIKPNTKCVAFNLSPPSMMTTAAPTTLTKSALTPIIKKPYRTVYFKEEYHNKTTDSSIFTIRKLLRLFTKLSGAGTPEAHIVSEIKKWTTKNGHQPEAIFDIVYSLRGNEKYSALLAFLYFHGIGTPVNHEKAFQWYRSAATMLLDPFAQFAVGNCLYSGKGTGQDHDRAVNWFKISVENSRPFPPAQFRLGICYLTGSGIYKDYDQAVYWLTKAARAGFSEAQWNLGCYYTMPMYGLFDYKIGMYWHTKAADSGHNRAQVQLSSFYLLGTPTTPRDVHRAIKLARTVLNRNHHFGTAQLSKIFRGLEFEKENA